MYITKAQTQILRKWVKINPHPDKKGIYKAALQHFGTLTDKEKASAIVELKMLISKYQSDKLN